MEVIVYRMYIKTNRLWLQEALPQGNKDSLTLEWPPQYTKGSKITTDVLLNTQRCKSPYF